MDFNGARVLVLLALLLAVGAPRVRGETIFVTQEEDVIVSGDGCSLREAISTANGSPLNADCTREGAPGIDTIVLQVGPIYLTLDPDPSDDDDDNNLGDLDIYTDMVIEGELTRRAVDGLGQGRLFTVHSGSVRFRNLEIRQGLSSRPNSAGGITNLGDGILYLENVLMKNNRFRDDTDIEKRDVHGPAPTSSNQAGAVFSTGIVFASECEFESNSMEDYQFWPKVGAIFEGAGAIYANTSVVLDRCTFTRNVGRNPITEGGTVEPNDPLAPYTAGAVSVITNDPSAMIAATDCVFDRNDGMNGGALLLVTGGNGGSVQAHGCTFTNNEAYDTGGAIYSDGPVLIEGSGTQELRRNSAQRAGGVAFSLFTVDVDGMGRIGDNLAGEGGVVAASDDIRMRNLVDVADNSATYGHGGVAMSIYGSITLEAVDGSVSGNEAYGWGGVAAALDDAATVSLRDVSANVRGNSAGDLGGVVYSAGRSSIERVQGTVSDNQAAVGGVVFAVDCRLYDTGALRGNSATAGDGGALFCLSLSTVEAVRGIYENSAARSGGAVSGNAISVRDVRGDIAGNTAGVYGGVASANSYSVNNSVVVIDGVAGSIRGNRADYSGGVAAALEEGFSYAETGAEHVLIANVSGDVADNQAGTLDTEEFVHSFGGVVSSIGGAALRNIGGDISGNAVISSFREQFSSSGPAELLSSSGGGVLYCSSLDTPSESLAAVSCVIDNVGGSITGNTALVGGGIFASTRIASISRVAGSVTYNKAQLSGGVIATSGQGRIVDVGGNVSDNTAGSQSVNYALGSQLGGGVVEAVGEALIARVAGEVSRNSIVGGGVGGVAASIEGDVRIVDCGALLGNRAAYSGGVAFSNGKVTIANIPGAISRNFAANNGGVALGYSVDIHNVGGSISYNLSCISDYADGITSGTGGVVSATAAVTIRNVAGDIRGNRCNGEFEEKLPIVGRGSGGVVFTLEGPVSIGEVGGSITRNGAVVGGVAVTLYGDVVVNDIGGDISLNRAEAQGGVLNLGLPFSSLEIIIERAVQEEAGFFVTDATAQITNVRGSIFGNTANGAYSSGGVVANEEGLVLIQGVSGSISGNEADVGGVILAYEGTIADVGGDIASNKALFGGVVCAVGPSAKIENVGGSIASNEALYNGAIIFTRDIEEQNVIVANIGGSITSNLSCIASQDLGMIERNVNEVHGQKQGPPLFTINGGAISGPEFEIGIPQGDSKRGFPTVSFVNVHDVRGDISYNEALGYGCRGGFVNTEGNAQVSNIGGSIEYNRSQEYGGFIYAQGGVAISNVGGSIRYNETEFAGGVAFSFRSAVIENVGGDISHNTADRGFGSFGVGFGTISGGGVLHTASGRISNVGGAVEYNRAANGGVIVSISSEGPGPSTAQLRNVAGPVRYNTATGYGGVLLSNGSAVVEDVGEISFNTAGMGGVAQAFYDISVQDVRGRVSFNEATYGPGGAFSTVLGGVNVSNVWGEIAYNRSSALYGYNSRDKLAGHGGFAHSETGSVLIANVAGYVCYNSAPGFGGVAYARERVSLENLGGDVCQNSAQSGGVLFSLEREASLADVNGDVRGNTATDQGGAIASYSGARVVRVSGDVKNNSALLGGVVLVLNTGDREGTAGAVIEDIGGDIYNNSARYGGGVMLVERGNGDGAYQSEVFGVIGRVGGDISFNSGLRGGVLWADYALAHVHDVKGKIHHNSGTYGGVVFSRAGQAVILDVGGIEDNTAAESGGVVYFFDDNSSLKARTPVLVSRVHGHVTRNSAAGPGGVVFVGSTTSSSLQVDISFVEGDVSYNTSTFGGGGVIYDENYSMVLTLQHVTGSVHRNSASQGSGGVLAGGRTRIEDIGGSVEYNQAYNYGGVAFAVHHAEVSDVGGHISYNRATHGGLIYTDSFFGDRERVHALVRDVAGAISYNTASGYGGVAFAYGSTHVTRVGGIAGNFAGYSGGAFYFADGSLVVDVVNGSIVGNTATDADGGFAAQANTGSGGAESGVLLRNVYGDILNNQAPGGYGGVLYTSRGNVLVRNVRGSIRGNRSGLGGGAVYAERAYAVDIQQVSGSIEGNVANGGYGGVVLSQHASILNVGGNISDNVAAAGGGVIAAFLNFGKREAEGFIDGFVVRIVGVGGDIANNRALTTDGGVVYSTQPVRIEDVVGSIHSNRARSGGVVRASQSVSILKVGGDLLRNTAVQFGGAVYVDDFVGGFSSLAIEDVQGSIAEHAAEWGGVGYVENGDLRVSRLRGSIRENTAVESGGAFYVQAGSAAIHDVAGSILTNEAFSGNGGMLAVTYRGEISDVFGRVCGNAAYGAGGVVYSEFGDVLLLTVGSGAIQGNVAGAGIVETMGPFKRGEGMAEYLGGVANALQSIRIDADDGIVHDNSPDVAFSRSGQFVEVLASLSTQNGDPAISVVTEPEGGVERVPLPVQPELDIQGAEPGKELPIEVTLVLQDETRIPLPGPWNIEFGETQRFLDLEVPVFGRNMYLEFSFAIKGCVHDDTESLVAATSRRFNVTECAYPHPVVCPSDISVPSELHECSSFVDVPLPSVARCSAPFFAHDADGAQLDSVASGQFAVGTTVVRYEASNSEDVTDDCIVYVTVRDEEAPRLVCPDDIVVVNDAGQCGAVVDVPEPTVADNCEPDLVALSSDHPDTFYPVGVTSLTWTGVDSGGNSDVCSLTVTVIDDELPVIECPGDLVVACGSPPTFQEVEGTDNCPASVTQQTNGPPIGSLTPLPSGATTFSFAVTDREGQRASCQWTVTTESTWYLDADGDGVGAGQSRVQCPAPGPSWVQDRNTDCDDTNPELGLVVYPDADGDTYGNPELLVCVAFDFFTNPEKRDVAADDAIDNLIVRAGDCDDTNFLVNPGMQEICGNGIDDNCDGEVDENCPPPPVPSLPTVPMPAVPLAPVPSVPTPIIIPTPLPQPPPPAPSVIDPIIIPEYTLSAASARTAGLAVLLISLFISYCYM
eukprot:TRINITY_DN256_c0_g1_i2.p1 TRINITY_DN256_c0_g1~~TRINITY_DN256_c0_g1_i2.p1  ORF type:complete len:2962 (-),score=1006.84 TRINITY_DN256_c0_g1_i2:157-9042(-)